MKRTSASSRRPARLNSKESSMKRVTESIRKELAALSARGEKDIDYSDLPPTTSDDWVGAVRGKFYRPIKQQLTVRIDADVLAWQKSSGKDYQSLLKAILRAAMPSKKARS